MVLEGEPEMTHDELEDEVRKLQERILRLEGILIYAPSFSPPSFTRHECIHCGKSYSKAIGIVYVCGAMPKCPFCDRTQMSWEKK